VLQSFTPYRYAEIGDLLADGVGLAMGAVLARLTAAAFQARGTWGDPN
jgi:VanZ family protein